jgi:hypothetical protein
MNAKAPPTSGPIPEDAFSVALSAAVREAGGRAMAAVKLNKPIAEVTQEE